MKETQQILREREREREENGERKFEIVYEWGIIVFVGFGDSKCSECY
ncbi:hypothetical protein [Salmonella sp. NW1113]